MPFNLKIKEKVKTIQASKGMQRPSFYKPVLPISRRYSNTSRTKERRRRRRILLMTSSILCSSHTHPYMVSLWKWREQRNRSPLHVLLYTGKKSPPIYHQWANLKLGKFFFFTIFKQKQTFWANFEWAVIVWFVKGWNEHGA